MDLPVFVSLATRRSPAPRSWRTSSGSLPPKVTPEGASLAFRFPVPKDVTASGPLRFSARRLRNALVFCGLLGPIPSCAAWFPGGKPPSQKPGPTLPAPLTGWSGAARWWFAASSLRRAVQLRTGAFHRLPAEIGSSVLSSPSCRFRLSVEAGTSVPITIW